MRTDQKVRGEEDCGRGSRLGSWRNHWAALGAADIEEDGFQWQESV